MMRREKESQSDLWIAAGKVATGPGNPFYKRLNAVLAKNGFDPFAEDLCEKFYADGKGRPGIAPGIYFRMLLVGYMEGIDSERGIAWRCADSLGLREFLGYTLTEATAGYSWPLCSIIPL